MNIGEAAHAAGVTAKMIRHYESLGLIAEASRTDAGYRQYTARDVTVLRFIRQSRSLGFAIRQIEQLLGLWADTQRESRDVKALAREHIADLDRKMAEMAQMKAALETMASACHGDQRADCPILRTLSSDAAAAMPIPKRAEKQPRADRTRRNDATPPTHGGLMAWMHGLGSPGAIGHA
ncbi:Cu(I)-responsive transcriptional regulator [Aquincola sp. S2]|uniref:Cu(I)-responsive transcriptional regulator n=2 Tax=Pseudaquabacterium terrae TaxID=2732868 RepID=A0ABX2ER35_9BURK|nr:Cu(I)-responsive transcriptional regulator [Aquabacterium terrae]